MRNLEVLVLLCLACAINSTLVPVPRGGYRPKECVHEVPSESYVYKEQDGSISVETPEGTVYSIPPCYQWNKIKHTKQISDSGWIAYANYDGNSFTSFNGTWKVPSAPKSPKDDQIVYLFTGLQDDVGDEIIQPVIQWGADVDGGGAYWGVASWWVTSSGQALYSKEVKIKSADTIFGIINSMNSTTWYISALINGKTPTTLIVGNIAPQTFAAVTLEAYQMQSCNDYPSDGSITFTQLTLKDEGSIVTPTWTPNIIFNDCNQNVQTSNPKTVTISY